MLAIISALDKHTGVKFGWIPGVAYLSFTPTNERSEDTKHTVPEIVLRILPTIPTSTARAKIFEALGLQAMGPIPVDTDSIKTEFLESITEAFQGFGRSDNATDNLPFFFLNRP